MSNGFCNSRQVLKFLPFLALMALAGCDITGEYEKRFQETLVTSGQRAAFDSQLFATETEITGEGSVGSGVKLRLPKIFDKDSKSLATEPRAQPPFLKLPGFGYALERALPDEANKFAPTYIYFAAVPKADQKPDQVQAPIAVALAAAFPNAAWSDVQVKTPQGTMLTHRVIRGEGPQDFDGSGSGRAVEKLDGRFALYFVEGPNHYALIGFRAPKAQGDKWFFEGGVEAAMGTVTAPAAAPAAAAAASTAPAGAAAPAAAGGAAAPAPAGGAAAPAGT